MGIGARTGSDAGSGPGEATVRRCRATAQGGISQGLAVGDRQGGRPGGHVRRGLVDDQAHRAAGRVVIGRVGGREGDAVGIGARTGCDVGSGPGEAAFRRCYTTAQGGIGQGLTVGDRRGGRPGGHVRRGLVDDQAGRAGDRSVVRIRGRKSHTVGIGPGTRHCAGRGPGKGARWCRHSPAQGGIGQAVAVSDGGGGRPGRHGRCGSCTAIDLRAGKIAAAVLSPRNQHLAIEQQRRRVSITGGVQRVDGRPRSGGRIIQLRAGKIAIGTMTSCHQYLPVVQQRRRVTAAASCHGPRRCSPCAVGRIIQLRAGKTAAAVRPPGDQHFAVVQQRRRVTAAGGCHGVRDRGPSAAGRIVKLRAGKIAAAVLSPCNQHLPIVQQCSGMHIACGVQRVGCRPLAGGRIVEFRAGKRAVDVIKSSRNQHHSIGQ